MENQLGMTRTTQPPVRLLSYYVGNVQSVGARERQEDSFAIGNAFDVKKMRDQGLLFAVCDGMGGMKDGKIASETAVTCIRNYFQNLNVSEDIAEQLRSYMLHASEQIEDILEGQGGSTAVVGVLYNEGLSFVSVGDSFLYLKRGSNLYRLNQEHTMCQQIFLECIRSGDINPETGRNDPETVALTQFLGMTGFNEIDGTVRPIPVMEGDVLFACSDGIGGTLDEREIFMALSRNDVHEMCSYIEKNVLAHGKPNQDNFTGVVVKCVK